ncbi:Rrf2 family transcriptional regulator [Ruficoccus sp. ZRK36]|uniref:Rrf2 family transcriptional regulator n=1 Tax=Ruficoccus sp. ZRK36 TaxID=2866311 RepID=UPI001C73D8F7|nr:Rrf2 family transcriptional regulator [Ruficoccus sp. ZRK36]QYY34534.1 Rrf2 family transcriptional regulator [Ruficoccus sp. ZRK36]
MVNSRMTVAIHVLCLLAYVRGTENVTSDYIAGSVNTNPVVIRRLLASLRKAGIVSSQGGSTGGWSLSRPPESISLLDIYRLLEPGDLFAMHNKKPNPRCPIGREIQDSIGVYYQRAEQGLERELAGVTIADVLGSVRASIGE